MSHISKINLVINDLEALEQACINLGFEFRKGQEKFSWFSRWVGDTPMPKGMTIADLGKCAHAIHVPGASYEVGIIDNKDGTYALVYDYWHSGGLEPLIGKQACFLAAEYGAVCAENEFRDNGYDFHREVTEDGFIEVHGTKLVEY